MKVGEAIPGVLRRQYAAVKGAYPLLTVPYLLRMEDVDALPILPCEAASDELGLVRADDDLSSLLEAFESRRLGFALVYEEQKAATLKLRDERGGCLVTQGKNVVAPWDVVMKPLTSGRADDKVAN